jgi:hypothetical protein
MANLAYLCVSPFDRLYPSFKNPDYDSSTHTVACCRDGVALLWIGLFRPDDIREAVFQVSERNQGEQAVAAWAPIASRDAAIRQLKEAVPTLDKLFPQWGGLAPHAELLEEVIAAADGPFVTIELEEAEVLHPEGTFRPRMMRALAFLAAPREVTAAIREDFVELTTVQADAGLPTAESLLEGEDLTDEESWNVAHVLGSGYGPGVPWE